MKCLRCFNFNLVVVYDSVNSRDHLVGAAMKSRLEITAYERYYARITITRFRRLLSYVGWHRDLDGGHNAELSSIIGEWRCTPR